MVLISFQGRANYSNLSRYSELSEKTYRRWFAKEKLDFIKFNQIGNNEIIPAKAIKVAAMDCSFVSKSGKKTYGLGNFYNGSQGKAQTGLEISTLAIVDVDFNTAYHVSTRQTSEKTADAEGSRIDEYLLHFTEDRKLLPADIGYLVTDGYYSKQKFTNGILEGVSTKSVSYAQMPICVIYTRANKNLKDHLNFMVTKSSSVTLNNSILSKKMRTTLKFIPPL